MASVNIHGGKFHLTKKLAKNGEISLYFTVKDDLSLVGKRLLLTPKIDSQGTIIWHCSSTITNQKLPANCQ